MFHHALVLVLGIGIGIGQYYWVLGALLGIVLTLQVLFRYGSLTVSRVAFNNASDLSDCYWAITGTICAG